jgi:hypothetical protein
MSGINRYFTVLIYSKYPFNSNTRVLSSNQVRIIDKITATHIGRYAVNDPRAKGVAIRYSNASA